METFTFQHLDKVAYISLYKDVKNGEDIRQRIVNASKLADGAEPEEQQAVNFAFIDASLVRYPNAMDQVLG